MKGYNMLINYNQNMLCLDEFDILELRENADECDYLFVVLVLSISLDTFYSNKNYAARKI